MYKIEIANETACIMLKDQEGNLINYQFINKYHFENSMTEEELQKEINKFAARNNVESILVN